MSSLSLLGCGTIVKLDTLATTVAPLSSEDLSGPCRYELLLPEESAPQVAVLVIFERGDSLKLFEDADLREVTTELHITTIFAHQCNSRSTGDLQADATKGPARALFAALTQFSALTQHPELARSPVLLYGFSAAGVLAITLTQAEPSRVLGAIPYAAGSGYLSLDNVPVSSGGAEVPMLMMANSVDSVVGTHRTLDYFDRGRSVGAPWAYAVQNDTGHCCNLSVKPLMIPWIRAIATLRTPAAPGELVSFHCTPDGVKDSYGLTDCRFTSAGPGVPMSPEEESGWLPDSLSVGAWLAWVTGTGTNQA